MYGWDGAILLKLEELKREKQKKVLRDDLQQSILYKELSQQFDATVKHYWVMS